MIIPQQFGFRGAVHGGLLEVVPPHLRVLSVRRGEEDHRCGQGDQEDPNAAEEEGEKRDKNPSAGSVSGHKHSEPVRCF